MGDEVNRMYARHVLHEVTGERYDFEEGRHVLDRMSDHLIKTYDAGKRAANSGLLPDGARRTWKNAVVRSVHLEPLDVHILVVEEDGRTRYIPIAWHKTENGQINVRRYDYGSYWNTVGAAVVEALSMRENPDDAVMGQACNKLLDLE